MFESLKDFGGYQALGLFCRGKFLIAADRFTVVSNG
jgi:hypothetical protein